MPESTKIRDEECWEMLRVGTHQQLPSESFNMHDQASSAAGAGARLREVEINITGSLKLQVRTGISQPFTKGNPFVSHTLPVTFGYALT